MKTRIEANVAAHEVYSCSYPEIHVVDWKKFNNENLRVHASIPTNPKTGQSVHSVCLKNGKSLTVLVDAFGENALIYSKKRKSRQCECVIYPDNYQETDWVLFIEMKYAEDDIAAFRAENNYPTNMIEQIKQTVQFFRDKKILSENKEAYAIVSFPNLLSSFNSTIFSIEDITNLYLDSNIIIRGTNHAEIISAVEIRLIG